MKKILLPAIILAFVFGCENYEQKYVDQKSFNDSLNQIISKRDASIDEFLTTMNEIESNLAEIKAKEGLLDISQQGELSVSQKDKINQDILNLYELIKKNKQKLSNLENKLYNSKIEIKQLNNMIKKLNLQLASKDSTVESLKDKLSGMNILVDSLFKNIDSMYQENTVKQEIISAQTDEINKAFFTIGTKKELMEKGVIDKKGGFIGIGKISQLKSNFNKENFTQIDITKKHSFPIKSKNYQILTTHPDKSYKITGTEVADSLKITDFKEFWSVSKYLVIIKE